MQKPLAYYGNNLDATLHLTEALLRHGVKALVFSSSATVYGASGEMPLAETAPRGACTNPYGWTKWMSEQILTDVAAAHPDFHVVLLRYFNPIGAHESGRIGEDPAGIPNNLMPYICQVAAGRLEWLSVYGNDYDTPDGTGVLRLHSRLRLGGGTLGGRWIRAHARPARRSSTSARGAATASWRWCTPSPRKRRERALSDRRPPGPGMWPPAMPTPARRSACSAGRRAAIWRTCAATPGTGRRTTPADTGCKNRKKKRQRHRQWKQ